MARSIAILVTALVVGLLGGCAGDGAPAAAELEERATDLSMNEYMEEVAAICDQRNDVEAGFRAEMDDLREDPAAAIDRLVEWGNEDQLFRDELLTLPAPSELAAQSAKLHVLLEERAAIAAQDNPDTTDAEYLLIEEEAALVSAEIALVTAKLWPSCEGSA